MMQKIRAYLIAGLLVWIPLWVTFLVLNFLIGIVDSTLSLLPKAYQPDNLLNMHVPGLGIVFSLVVVFVTGVVARNFIGKHLVQFGESILQRIPLVRAIYSAVKQVLNTIFSTQGDAFRRVLFVEYPRKGLWSIAFQTSVGFKEGEHHLDEQLVTIFIPTTPNPTSGFLMMIPKKDTIELNMSVDEALRLVISLGVVLPDHQIKEIVRGEENA